MFGILLQKMRYINSLLVYDDVDLEEQNCLCAAVLCTIIMVHKDTSSSYRLVDYIGL